MKALSAIVFFGITASVLSGCFGTPEPEAKDVAVQFCNEPKYTISIGQINTTDTNIFPKGEFKAMLEQNLRDSNCFSILAKPNSDTYVLNVEYGVKIDKTTEETSAVSSKDFVNLTSEMRFTLHNAGAKKTITQNALSTLKVSGKKVLGVGENVEITNEQKRDVIYRNFKTIFSNLAQTK